MTAFSRRRILSNLFLFLIIIVLCQAVVAAEKVFHPEDIRQRLRIHNGPVIADSDSLLLGNRTLAKDVDYTIDYLNGVVYINCSLHENDTLVVCFTPLPTWLKKYYGVIPNESGTDAQRTRPSSDTFLETPKSTRSSGIVIKGAKKFSVLTQTGGSSNFNQSLDLTIKGEMSPGLEISGSVSDRDYDPAYGTVNSRISELDKLNLRVQSKTFYSEIGNLEIKQRSDYGFSNIKQVSGMQAVYSDRNFSMSGLLARPRGRFQTVKLTGIDKVQGPYRATVNNRSVAVVPGSERVWLDGQVLRRGGDKDYIMDYPSGEVTFTQKVLIDSRSRIEIDFEPLTNDYQQEIYQVSSGVSSSDSTIWLKLDFMRQADDKNRLKTGELSSDDIKLLESIGDSVELNYRDGAVVDSFGSYIELYDTLGLRYFEYVGDSLGDYAVGFSSVGYGNGDYVYNGADEFEYVGIGNGDYKPFVQIPVPSREDFFEAEVGLNPLKNSAVKAIVRQSDYDKNLYSNSNDNNNRGGQYIFTAEAGLSPSIHSDKFGLVVSMDIINKNFKPRQRRNRPDLSRIYLIPDNISPEGDQKEGEIKSAIIVPGPYNLYLRSGYLNYKRQFDSYYGTVAMYADKQYNFLPTVLLTRLNAQLDTSGVKKDGRNEIVSVTENYRFNKQFSVMSSFKYDRRWNEYSTSTNGTTDWIYDLNVKYRVFTVEYQKHYDDTLITDWQSRARRDKVIFTAKTQTGAIKTDLYLVGQRVDEESSTEDQFMARLNMAYIPTSSNITINGSYMLSDENRNERGVRYIEVEAGQGRYIFENGQYIPDANGNYIEIEEIQSGTASVKKGEKSFGLNYYPKGMYLRLMSNISEDLPAAENRKAQWILPFYSDEDINYFYRKLYYSGDLKFIEIKGAYFVNLAASYNFEERQLSGRCPKRYKKQFRTRFNEAFRKSRFSQEVTFFEYLRDSYYSSAGDINGFKVLLSYSLTIGRSQIFSSAAYRYAEDVDLSHSKLIALVIYPQLRFAGEGEMSLKLEPYLQQSKTSGTVSYRLTDDHYGKRGMRWVLRTDYKLRKDLKVSLSFDGRFSDDRKPRITGRGELVASF